MHEYTETESKHTGKIGTHSMLEKMNIIFWVKNYAEWSEAKNFWNLKIKHTFYVNNHSPNIFPVLANFSLCQNKIPCVFPVWKK